MTLRLPPPNSIQANYDFTDLIQKLGYVTFYAVNHTDYHTLSRQAIASQVPMISENADVNHTDRIDIDLDFPINVPVTVAAADLYVSAAVDLIRNVSHTCFMKVYVYHVSAAAVETSIGSNATPTAVTVASAANGSARIVTKVALSKKKFNPGTKLRVNIVIQSWLGAGVEPNALTLWIDGAGRGATTYNQINPDDDTTNLSYTNTTELTVEVPFEIRI